MFTMLRSAAAKITRPAAASAQPRPETSPVRNFLLTCDGQPFMMVNATLEHAQFIVAGFSADHAWDLLPQN